MKSQELDLKNLSETDIQLLILDWLNRNRIFCWRNNTMGVYDPKTGTYRKGSKFSLTGVSDILGILPNGRFLAIEVKSKTGKVSNEQHAFINKINKTNGLAFVARSLDEVIENLKGII